MKRCPACNRTETDDALAFCRADGATLVREADEDAGTIRLGAPQGVDVDPRALTGDAATPDDVSRRSQSAGTTLLESRPTPGHTRELKKPKSRRGIVTAAAVSLVVAAAAVAAYVYTSRGAGASAINSVAVLPFVNASGDRDAEYLSDGVAESLMNSLSQLPDLKVAARNSAFRYKGRDQDAQQVGKELGVRAVLTGSVKEIGDQILISVSLDDARDGQHIWGDQYARRFADIFEVQRDIARQVTDNLRVRLTGAQREQITRRYTENPDAYRLYLQGRYLHNQATEDGITRAITFYDQALALDPRYSLARASRGEAFFNLADATLPNAEAMPKAKQDITAALGMDDNLVEARTVLAEIEFQYDWDFPRAEEDLKRAIALNPNYAEAHRQYGWFLAEMGKPLEGAEEMKIEQRLDPVSMPGNTDLNVPYYLARRFDDSMAVSRNALEMFPNSFLPHYTLGWAAAQKGDYATAIPELQKAGAMEPTPFVTASLAYTYAKAGRRDEARKLLTQLQELSKRRYVTPYWFGMIHTALDEKDEAFVWFEKAYRERSFWLIWLKTDPALDSLRPDPRFTDLMRRVGFTP